MKQWIVYMLVLILTGAHLHLAHANASQVQHLETGRCNTMLINTLDFTVLLPLYHNIKQCVDVEGAATVYVTGPGGNPDNALAFVDLMRVDGLSQKVTFIGFGQLASAMNIFWLAADQRVVLPTTTFLWHRATLNAAGEDTSTREQDAAALFTNTQVTAERAVPAEVAARFTAVLRGNAQGAVLTATEAIELGWATAMRGYAK